MHLVAHPVRGSHFAFVIGTLATIEIGISIKPLAAVEIGNSAKTHRLPTTLWQKTRFFEKKSRTTYEARPKEEEDKLYPGLPLIDIEGPTAAYSCHSLTFLNKDGWLIDEDGRAIQTILMRSAPLNMAKAPPAHS
jgi:hypothetical protein